MEGECFGLCGCLSSALPCTVQERPSAGKDYSQPLCVDTSLQYSRLQGLGLNGDPGVGLLMALVTPGPDVAETQTVKTTTVIQGSQKTIPSEEHYDPYLASTGFTEPRPVSHDLDPHNSVSQPHPECIIIDDDLEVVAQGHVAVHSDRDRKPIHDFGGNPWQFRQGDDGSIYTEGCTYVSDRQPSTEQNKHVNYTSHGGLFIDMHSYGYPDSSSRCSSHRVCSEASDGYWENSNDSSDTTDSYWNQQTQYNFPDYDILNRSQGNTATNKNETNGFTRTVYGDYPGSVSSTASSVEWMTSGHTITMGQHVYGTAEGKKSVGMVSRHCGQMAGHLITPDFFKSNIYAEEWIMNH